MRFFAYSVAPLFEASRDLCIVPCAPASSCQGDNYCAPGYASKPPMFRCASCAPGFYTSAQRLQPLPRLAPRARHWHAAALAGVAMLGFWLNKRGVR